MLSKIVSVVSTVSKFKPTHYHMLDLRIDTRVQLDTTKPIGEACNADGTLKDASEISWLHSPSEAAEREDERPPPFYKRPPAPSFHKRTRSVDLDAQTVDVNSKRPRVSKNLSVEK